MFLFGKCLLTRLYIYIYIDVYFLITFNFSKKFLVSNQTNGIVFECFFTASLPHLLLYNLIFQYADFFLYTLLLLTLNTYLTSILKILEAVFIFWIYDNFVYFHAYYNISYFDFFTNFLLLLRFTFYFYFPLYKF